AEQTHAKLDTMFGMPMRYSLGFMLGRSRLSMFQGNTRQAFGHLGLINVVGYADRERDISIGIMTSGKHGITSKAFGFWNILRTIAHTVPTVPHGKVQKIVGF
ncbi:MAG: serine hydrolase, partial [Pseudomonadales bacterium]|nr:serine hydrolase [Pseudomonadales bacterium]